MDISVMNRVFFIDVDGRVYDTKAELNSFEFVLKLRSYIVNKFCFDKPVNNTKKNVSFTWESKPKT